MITEQQVQWAMDVLIDRESQAAKARAAHEHTSDMDKVILAQLMFEAPGGNKNRRGTRKAGRECTLITGRIWTKKRRLQRWTIRRATGDLLPVPSLRRGGQSVQTHEPGRR
jgi:hypothetical protein